jgi:hypothetical protein
MRRTPEARKNFPFLVFSFFNYTKKWKMMKNVITKNESNEKSKHFILVESFFAGVVASTYLHSHLFSSDLNISWWISY